LNTMTMIILEAAIHNMHPTCPLVVADPVFQLFCSKKKGSDDQAMMNWPTINTSHWVNELYFEAASSYAEGYSILLQG
jgi:hypothetical protein